MMRLQTINQFLLFGLVLFSFSKAAIAQSGEVYGTVMKKRYKSFSGVKVTAYQNGMFKAATVTESDGSYSLKPLRPGCYDILFEANRFMTTKIIDVAIKTGEPTKVSCKMQRERGMGKSVICSIYDDYASGLRLICGTPVSSVYILDGELSGDDRTYKPMIDTTKTIYKYFTNNPAYSENTFRYLPIPVFLKGIITSSGQPL